MERNDPTPEEISERKAAIQEQWSEYQRRQREVTLNQGWTPLQCRAHCAEPVEGDAA